MYEAAKAVAAASDDDVMRWLRGVILSVAVTLACGGLVWFAIRIWDLGRADGIAVANLVVAVVGVGVAVLAWRFPAPSTGGQSVISAGEGAVAVGGSITGEVSTHVEGGGQLPPPPSNVSGVVSLGPGAVAVGGDIKGSVRTRVKRPARE